MQRKKRFAGHTIAGYACEPHFSPDGRFLSSGDGQGNMVFWDFKTGRISGRLNRAHKQVIISHDWLPHEHVRSLSTVQCFVVLFGSRQLTSGSRALPLQSKLVTSSWDGLIKLWT